METNYNVLILCGVCVFLLIMNIIEQWQNTKREDDLLNRLMANSHDDYMRNRIIASSKPQKPEYIGEVESSEEADLMPVD